MNKDIELKLQDTMTVEELIERLQELDGASKVLFSVSYGDHGRTMQALPVRNADEYDTRTIVKSAYSKSGLAFDEDGDMDENNDDVESVVILTL